MLNISHSHDLLMRYKQSFELLLFEPRNQGNDFPTIKVDNLIFSVSYLYAVAVLYSCN